MLIILHYAPNRIKCIGAINEVLSMPFDASYIDHDKGKYFDSQDYLVAVARKIIRDPLSTHVIKMETKEGKIRFLIVDRKSIPKGGEIAVISGDFGYKAGRVKSGITANNVFGKVIWILQEG